MYPLPLTVQVACIIQVQTTSVFTFENIKLHYRNLYTCIVKCIKM